ncbi:MAG: MBL fold metallo-hydrolase, partial [Saprospiraceae bacterium]|nr:MBL fold metallo-hydrolase [Saprospiraceae bacterium]
TLERSPVALGITDPISRENWLIEATPAIKHQWQALTIATGFPIVGIFITHAHAGHYTGLINLGREMMSATAMPVYALPRLSRFLKSNGPWEQLVQLGNIEVRTMAADSAIKINDQFLCKPVEVPHRDEYSETAGFVIQGPKKKALFIPDIDKWQKWPLDLVKMIMKVDYALLDGTFFSEGELPGRDMSAIPHPFVVETLEILKNLDAVEKKKVYFLHFNHTNPLIWGEDKAVQIVQEAGMNVAEEGMRLDL